MSRTFAGGSAAEVITFDPGNAPPDAGPITVAMLAKWTGGSSTGYAVQGVNAGSSGTWGALISGNLFIDNDFSAGYAGVVNGAWCWYVATKASGSTPPRWHVKNVTAGSAWAHADGPGNVNDGSGPIVSIRVGQNVGGGSGSTWRGDIAAIAAWDTQLNDAAVEAACTLAAADLLAAAPGWGVLLDQASTATAVTDFTGGGGDQTALTGTSVSADEPPGWSYDLAPDLVDVARRLTARWNVRAGVERRLTARWNVRAAVERRLTARWNIRKAVAKRLTARWLIASDNPLGGPAVARIRALSSTSVTREVGGVWDLLADVRDAWDRLYADAPTVTVTLPSGDQTLLDLSEFTYTAGIYLAQYVLPSAGRYHATMATESSGSVSFTAMVTAAATSDSWPTLEDLRGTGVDGDAGYLGSNNFTDEDIQDALNAEQVAQARVCRIPTTYDADLRQALMRRVARNLSMRRLPLAVLRGDAEAGDTVLPGNDPEVRRLERPYRKLPIG